MTSEQILTVLGLEIAVQDHGSPCSVGHGFRVASQTHYILSSRGWILAVVAAVQSADNLTEDGPDEFLLGQLVFALEVLNDAAKIAIAAVLHVEVEVLRGLEVLPFVVADNVWMDELLQDGQLGLQLLFFLCGHL